MKIITYILFLFLLAFHRTILSEVTSIYGAIIDLSAMMVALIGIYKSESTALWFAMAVAIVSGSQNLELMPWEMLILGFCALMANQVSNRVNLESMTSRVMIIAAVVFIHRLILLVVISPELIIYLLYRDILPCMIYTVIVSWVFFHVKDSKITFGKAKSQY